MTIESGWNREEGLAGYAGDLYLASMALRDSLANLHTCQRAFENAEAEVENAKERVANAETKLREEAAK